MHMNMINVLVFKKMLSIYKSDIFFLSLLALHLELFAAQDVMNFTALNKPAKTNLYSLFLECNVSDTPSNVAMYRKYPLSRNIVRKFNPKEEKFLYEAIEFENESCTNVAGQYECKAVYHHKVVEAKTINLFRKDCQLILCDAKLNNTVTYAALGDDVNLTTCVWGTSEEINVELYDNQDRHSLKYPISHQHNTTSKYNNITAQLFKISSSNFGVYRIKVKPNKYANQSIVIYFQILEREHPTLCDGTSKNTVILAVTNKAAIEICVKPSDTIYTVTINDITIFDHELIQSSQYTMINRTDDDKIYLTIEVLNLTKSSPDKYVVKIVTTSGLQLVFQFNVKINEVREISPDCFTTQNATSVRMINNTVTIYVCVNKTDTISSLEVNDRPINDTVTEYTIKNKTVGDNTQFIIEFWNLKNDIDRKAPFVIKTNSGEKMYYFFDFTFHKGVQTPFYRSLILFMTALLGILVVSVFGVSMVFLVFKQKTKQHLHLEMAHTYDTAIIDSETNRRSMNDYDNTIHMLPKKPRKPDEHKGNDDFYEVME